MIGEYLPPARLLLLGPNSGARQDFPPPEAIMLLPVRSLAAVAALVALPLGSLAADDAKAVEFFENKKSRRFWTWRPPTSRDAKSSERSAATPIDSFVAEKWVEKGLNPVAAADRRTLIRRAFFDLIGLPPSPEDVDAFIADTSSDAFAKLIDKLLANPHYGERWARYWLDVARYAEDQAHTFGVKPKTNAWVYRDWVIKAFNSDMPYDRFVKLQLAGDHMADAEPDDFTRM